MMEKDEGRGASSSHFIVVIMLYGVEGGRMVRYLAASAVSGGLTEEAPLFVPRGI